MVELLGVLLGGLLLWAGAVAWRGLRAAARALGRALRTPHGRFLTASQLRLRASRATRRSQAARIAALTAELERARLRLRAAERERGRAPAPAPGAPALAGEDGRFARAKRAFALHFHPDGLRGHPDAPARGRAFREFWPVLRRIERG